MIRNAMESLNSTIADNLQYIGDSIEYQGDLVQERLGDIIDRLEGIEEKLKLDPCEPDFPEGETITQVVGRFVDEYQPGVVEVLENDVVINGEDVYSRRNGR